MASGDACRTWFPELVEMLHEEWNSSLTLHEIISIRDNLAALLQSIREERNILPPMMWCSGCEKRHRSAPIPVSVGAVIFALKRFNFASENEIKMLDKEWKKYRNNHQFPKYKRPERSAKRGVARLETGECRTTGGGNCP